MSLPFDQPGGVSQKDPLPHLRYHKTIGLAVSGDVKLTALEVDIVDSRDFQRLRWIQQLGPSSWVYPTALHTRFDHSLGALKVADTMIAAIREGLMQVDPKADRSPARCNITHQQRILARLYAMLHDITHVPFGHTLEDELRIFGSHDVFDDIGSTGTDGGERFDRLLGPESDIGSKIIGHLGDAMYERLRNIFLRGKDDRLEVDDYEGKTYDEFIYYLVSDTVCADLIDYLERDSYFCSLGLYIHKRFLDYLYVADVDLDYEGLRRRVIVRLWKPRDELPRRDIMTDLAGLLDSRYKLAERVYFHHTKIIVGAMIGRAVLEAKLAGFLSSSQMLSFGDQTLLNYLRTIGEKLPAEALEKNEEAIQIVVRLAAAVLDRRLYTQLYRYRQEEFGSPRGTENSYKDLIQSFQNATDRRRIENEIAALAGGGPGDVLIYVASPKMNKKIARAVVDYQDEQTLLEKVKDPVLKGRLENIGEAHERLWNADLLVAPEMTSEQMRLVRLAFQAKFMPHQHAEDAYCNLISATVANDNMLSNWKREELTEACQRAAKRLVAKQGAVGHDLGPREILLETLREELGRTGN